MQKPVATTMLGGIEPSILAPRTVPVLESDVVRFAREHLARQGYTEIFVPRMVRATGACENVDTLFEVSVGGDDSWFNVPHVYLAQTGQLYLEAWVPSLGRAYCVGPSFRAEEAVDSRHLSEFTMVEIELVTDFQGLLGAIEGIFGAVREGVLGRKDAKERYGLSPQALKMLEHCAPPFPKMTYDEAIEALQKLGKDISWGDDIDSANEALLVTQVSDKPLFITHYPNPLWDHGKSIEVEKFFNMQPDPAKPHLVQSADLILPYAGEAVGSAARIYDAKTLIERLTGSRMFKRLQEKGGSLDDFGWYVNQMQTRGSVPHAGCGIGVSRVLKWLRQEDDIRRSVTFPINRANII